MVTMFPRFWNPHYSTHSRVAGNDSIHNIHIPSGQNIIFDRFYSYYCVDEHQYGGCIVGRDGGLEETEFNISHFSMRYTLTYFSRTMVKLNK